MKELLKNTKGEIDWNVILSVAFGMILTQFAFSLLDKLDQIILLLTQIK